MKKEFNTHSQCNPVLRRTSDDISVSCDAASANFRPNNTSSTSTDRSDREHDLLWAGAGKGLNVEIKHYNFELRHRMARECLGGTSIPPILADLDIEVVKKDMRIDTTGQTTISFI